MFQMKIIMSLLSEYGVRWSISRALYAVKLFLFRLIPSSERLYEKKVLVKRIGIFKLKVTNIHSFLLNLPRSDKEYIIKIADNAMKGIIKGFSAIELNYGFPLNWQLNPLSGASFSTKDKWYRIKDFDNNVGDIKVVWEASRFTHFFYFIRAYLITNNVEYYQAFSCQLNDWVEKNPYSYGVNFKCGQECALRMINTLIAYCFFSELGLADETDKKNVFKLVESSYRKILSNFEYAHKCIKNNHTLSELCGMIIGAWCCNDDKIMRKAYKLLNKEICFQFSSDGGYKQFSFNYQRFALQICECVISLSKSTGIEIERASIDRICRSAFLLYQCQAPNGNLPNYGANDGALIFPVSSCDYLDYRPVINAVYAITSGKRLYQEGHYDEELLWFGIDTDTIENVAQKQSDFDEAGVFTLRNKDCFAMICLNNFNSRPSHMDQLHFDLWYQGKNVFCDSGTYSYNSDLGEDLSLTSCHNTVKITEKEQMNKYGNFMICNWSKSSIIQRDENLFEGMMISQNGYSHKRRITMFDSKIEIIDEIFNSSDYEIRFHTPFNCVQSNGDVLIIDEDDILCVIHCPDSDISLSNGYRSRKYMEYEEISVLCIKGNTKRISVQISFGDFLTSLKKPKRL